MADPMVKKMGPVGGGADEDQRAVALTVIWMLTAVASLAAEVVALAAMALNRVFADPAKLTTLARVLPGWFLFCAMTTGLICIVLTPLAWRLRESKPPRSVMVAAVAIGLVPIATLVVLALART